jgi:hypothetical protein
LSKNLNSKGLFYNSLNADQFCLGIDCLIAKGGDKYLQQVWMRFTNPSKELQAIHTGKKIISNNGMVVVMEQGFQPFFGGFAHRQAAPLSFEVHGHGIPDPFIIIYEQYSDSSQFRKKVHVLYLSFLFLYLGFRFHDLTFPRKKPFRGFASVCTANAKGYQTGESRNHGESRQHTSLQGWSFGCYMGKLQKTVLKIPKGVRSKGIESARGNLPIPIIGPANKETIKRRPRDLKHSAAANATLEEGRENLKGLLNK